MPENDLKSLRDALIRCCEDYNADEAIRAILGGNLLRVFECVLGRRA